MENKKVEELEVGDKVFFDYKPLVVIKKSYNCGAFGDYYSFVFYDEKKDKALKPVHFDFGARISIA